MESSVEIPLKTVFSKKYALLLNTLIDGRKAASLTQTNLAALLLKPQSFVSKYERGERRLDVVEMVEICDLLKIDPHTVIDKIQACASERQEAKK